MSIIDSKTGKIRKDYTFKELIEKAREMRAYNMIAITRQQLYPYRRDFIHYGYSCCLVSQKDKT